MPRPIFPLGLAFSVILPGLSLAADYETDHPLFAAYPNAELEKAEMIDYEKYVLPASVIDTNQSPETFTALDIVGDLYRHEYHIENVSSLKIYENYVAAASGLGFKEIFSCELDACGTDESANSIGNLLAVAGDVYNSYRNPYYWIGEMDGEKGKIIAAWFIGAYEDETAVQQVIVEAESLETGLIAIDESYASLPATQTSTPPLSADEKAKDSPIVPRYPGAELSDHQLADTETVTIPAAVNAADQKPVVLTGDLSRHMYTIENVSTLKVYENYMSALMQAGFTVISQCALDQCGTQEQTIEVGDQLALSGSVYNSYRKPYYIVARNALPAGSVYVALFIGGYESETSVQQVVLQEKAVQTGLITVNADGLKQQIDTDGKALIYGIYFDTGKADVKAESTPTLDVIAELLEQNPELLLYVVGHTDDTGEGAANLALSRQRADAVVAALVADYDVTADRLLAQGVGPYAPAGNNTSDDGRQKNRRVELVKRLR